MGAVGAVGADEGGGDDVHAAEAALGVATGGGAGAAAGGDDVHAAEAALGAATGGGVGAAAGGGDHLAGGVAGAADGSGAGAATRGGDNRAAEVAAIGGTNDSSDSDEEVPLRRSDRVRIPSQRYSPSLLTILAKDIPEPANSKEALSGSYASQWMDAQQAEMQSLRDKGVYQLVGSVPKGARVIPTRFVYKVKGDKDGNLDRFKARLVAQGFRQDPFQIGETFAPTGSLSTLRSLLAYTAEADLHIHQMDFKTAFLQADLRNDVFISLPPEAGEGKGLVYKLNKAIYGLKESPRAWYDALTSGLRDLELLAADSDTALFVKRSKDGGIVLLFCHVDDILISGRLEHVMEVKAQLNQKFDVTDMGEAQYMLGMEVTRDWGRGTLGLSQRKYTAEILDTFGMADSHSIGNPAAKRVKTEEEGKPLGSAESELYRSMVGSLQWLSSGTRPDISFAVSEVGRHSSAPTTMHMTAVKRIFRYLNGTRDLGILYGSGDSSAEPLVLFSDASWGGVVDGKVEEFRRSHTGYAVLWRGVVVSWSSRLQPTVATSTQEAEYMAASAATKEALSMRKVFKDFGLVMPLLEIRSDSQSAISLAHNPMVQARSKHIDIQHHFVRDRVMRNEVALSYCPTEEMVADMLTKALDPEQVKKCREGMGIIVIGN